MVRELSILILPVFFLLLILDFGSDAGKRISLEIHKHCSKQEGHLKIHKRGGRGRKTEQEEDQAVEKRTEQRTAMAEEHKCQTPPEGHRLCANNCGFFGSAATFNLCSKCYRDLHLNSPTNPLPPSPPSPTTLKTTASTTSPLLLAPPETLPSASNSTPPTHPTRCGLCRKRVGLTGFRCRCGQTYCGAHRYPEKHSCGYDFKSAGKDAIARANPVVKASKLDRI